MAIRIEKMMMQTETTVNWDWMRSQIPVLGVAGLDMAEPIHNRVRHVLADCEERLDCLDGSANKCVSDSNDFGFEQTALLTQRRRCNDFTSHHRAQICRSRQTRKAL